MPSIRTRPRAGARASSSFRGFESSDLSPITKFDCVIISEVLEHLEAPEALLRAALPYLAESGILIVTVPNGYGEFELDRRLFRALRFDRLVAWLWSALNGDKYEGMHAGSGCGGRPHLQRFTLGRLRKMFARNSLVLLEGVRDIFRVWSVCAASVWQVRWICFVEFSDRGSPSAATLFGLDVLLQAQLLALLV